MTAPLDHAPGPFRTADSAPAAPRTAGWAARLAVGLVGLVLLGFLATVTLGLAVLGALGVLAAILLRRRRNRPVTYLVTWLAAVAGAALGFLALTGVATTRIPRDTFDRARENAIEAERHPAPPPAWVQRMFPPTPASAAAQKQTEQLFRSRGFFLYSLLFGLLFGSAMIGMFVGTTAWGAALAIAYAVRGRGLADPPASLAET